MIEFGKQGIEPSLSSQMSMRQAGVPIMLRCAHATFCQLDGGTAAKGYYNAHRLFNLNDAHHIIDAERFKVSGLSKSVDTVSGLLLMTTTS